MADLAAVFTAVPGMVACIAVASFVLGAFLTWKAYSRYR